MKRADYRLIGSIGHRATLGLVVLSTDETIEHDARRICGAPDIALHVTRIAQAPVLSPETLAEMEGLLAASAALLPAAASFGSVGYACTSGTAHIGAETVARHLRDATGARATTDPMTASVAALHALGCSRIGLVSPYSEAVVTPLVAQFERAGVTVAQCVSFDEVIESNVARIDPTSILDAATALGAAADVDAVFLSCTNLRTMDILDTAEERIDKPVVSSNQALLWHMMAQAGLDAAPSVFRPGRLMQHFPRP